MNISLTYSSEVEMSGYARLLINDTSYQVLCGVDDLILAMQNAKVICKELGYRNGTITGNVDIDHGKQLVAYNLGCHGNESTILDCNYTPTIRYLCELHEIYCSNSE